LKTSKKMRTRWVLEYLTDQIPWVHDHSFEFALIVTLTFFSISFGYFGVLFLKLWLNSDKK
jgi:hypothetical protein